MSEKASYLPRVNAFAFREVVRPGRVNVWIVRLLRDERPCEADHGDCRALVGLACRECGAVI